MTFSLLVHLFIFVKDENNLSLELVWISQKLRLSARTVNHVLYLHLDEKKTKRERAIVINRLFAEHN